jgi:molybdopterin synthase sulfur carrier subunit
MHVAAPEIQVAIPSALRRLCGSDEAARTSLWLTGRTVQDLLSELARRYPEVHSRLCDEQGRPRPHINVFVNDDHVRARAGLQTALMQGDLVTILPAVSGG